MDIKQIKQQLAELADEQYRDFHCRLVPGMENNLGVRAPQLKKLAKEIAKEDWQSFLAKPDDSIYEMTLLQGLVIGYAKADWDTLCPYMESFIKRIDNWAVNDSFVTNLKAIVKKNREQVWQFIQPYFSSSAAYDLRFGVVMLLDYFVDEEHGAAGLSILNNIRHDDYYVKMAVAWAISVYYIKLPELTLPLLLNNQMDDFTHNKAIQKIRESLRVDKETKDYLNTLKR